MSTLTGAGETIAWSPDGTHLAAAGADGQITVFDLDSRSWLAHLWVAQSTCMDWASPGIAVGGPNGVVVLDLAPHNSGNQQPSAL